MNSHIADVAQAAGVSTATVSRALRGLPNVSAQTRARVEQVAAELGYIADRSASRLASGRTLAVAVIAPYPERWFFATAISAVENELRAAGMDALLVGLTPPGVPREAFRPGALRGRVDAVIVLTVPLTGRELDELRSLDLPTVFVGASVGGSMSVRIDDARVAALAMEHLLALGHRRIAYIGGDPTQRLNFTTPADRRAGWLSSLREAGIEPASDWEHPGDFTAVGGALAVERLLALDPVPTAIFAASDEMAIGAMIRAQRLGLNLPGDLSIVGVDGHDLSELLGLTTVEQPVAEQAARAARMVLEDLRTGRSFGGEHVVMPVRLAVRDSTTTWCDRSLTVTQP